MSELFRTQLPAPPSAEDPDRTTDVARATEPEVALRSLTHVLVGDQSVEDTLHQVAVAAVTAIRAYDDAGVTLVHGKGHRTAACTNEETLVLDQAQYESGEGPCLEAISTGSTVAVTVAEAWERWPAFASMAEQLGLRIFLGAPLVVNDTVIGALNLYGRTGSDPDDYDPATLLVLCQQASVTLANAARYADASQLVEQLTEAIGSRAVIEQAKGVLMHQHGVDPDEAFRMLRRQSQRTNRKLRVIATEIVRSTHGPARGQLPRQAIELSPPSG